ncbi:MAG: hypothetical protein WCJ07_01910 [Verrucomicrobiota bacterium]
MAKLNATRPMKDASTSKPGLTQKYSALTKLFKYRSRVVSIKPGKTEPFVMPDDPGKKIAEQTSAEITNLIEEKLIRRAAGQNSKAGRFELTNQGRRFIADYERVNKVK